MALYVEFLVHFTETDILQIKHVGLAKWLTKRYFFSHLGTQHQLFYVLSTLSGCWNYWINVCLTTITNSTILITVNSETKVKLPSTFTQPFCKLSIATPWPE